MIQLNELSFSYSAGENALSEVSFNLNKGEVLGLVGANGSGKSTLMSVIAGIHTPTKGGLTVADRTSPGKEKSIRLVCRLVMQDADLQILGATVEEDLLLGRKPSPEVVNEAKAMAERFNLLKAWETPVQNLSWGMKRKLCLASALMDRPVVLLLDEPFSGLDYPGIKEIRAIIAENAKRGLTQIVSSHDLESCIDLVSKVALMDSGVLAEFGGPEEVLDRVGDHGVRAPSSWRLSKTIVPWDED